MDDPNDDTAVNGDDSQIQGNGADVDMDNGGDDGDGGIGEFHYDDENGGDKGVASDGEDPDESQTGIDKEPRYDRTNKLQFHFLCDRLEQIEKNRSKLSKDEKLKLLLPPLLLEKIHPHSLYPLFRLLVPEKDSSRSLLSKEKSLATAYTDALGYEKNNKYYLMLQNWTDPAKLAEIHSGQQKVAGDFSLVVEKVLERRIGKQKSKATIGQINQQLDWLSRKMAEARNQKKTSNHWRNKNQSQDGGFSQSQSQSIGPAQGKKSFKSQTIVRRDFIKALVNQLKLSPLEHKWLIRIILENVKVGLGFESILGWYSRHALDLWKAHNSLKAVCNKLCNPEYTRQREKEVKEAEERMKKERFAQLYAFSMSPDPVRLGFTLSAMRSERTSFEKLMADMSAKHLEVLKKKLSKDEPRIRNSLALKFPAFISEIKLDGERMLVHFDQGKVTMHTRQVKWYSRIYSPIVGPGLRRALSNYNVDLILDGEVLAWDGERKQNIPFGQNRPVALARRKWLTACGEIEEIDEGLHPEGGKGVVSLADVKTFTNDDERLEGEQCWLKFVAFDVLYVGGPDAAKVFAEALPDESVSQEALPSPGSIIHLSLFERKRILYHLIKEERDKIEIVQSVVIRPNGECVSGVDYFSVPNPYMECGLPAYVLDSAKWTLNRGHESLEEFDTSRRKGREDTEISKRRTQHLNSFYHQIVEVQKLEGLVNKDLSSPYILQNRSKLWTKIKPDYMNDTHASDLDVVVIGGSFASGHRHSGGISSFLCACVDSKDRTKFLTLCRINAGSLKNDAIARIMEHTGFKLATGETPVEFGKWFEEENHWVSLPDFISRRSFQSGKEDNNGWRFDRVKNYPNLWIRPEDSVVLTVSASEIVASDEYSAGITFRFPKAKRLRLDDDEKPASEVETEEGLYDLFNAYIGKMQQSAARVTSSEFTIPSPSKMPTSGALFVSRFLTVEQFSHKQKARKQKPGGRVQSLHVIQKESNALTGQKFHVIEGIYNFDKGSIDAEDAEREGWLEEATRIRSANDVRSFIKRHNGQVLRTPGMDTRLIGPSIIDNKVLHNIRGYDKLREKKDKRDKKRAKKGKDIEPVDSVSGVLKWTFLYSAVHRWLNERDALMRKQLRENDSETDSSDEQDDDDEEDCIQLWRPQLLKKPRFFDYLCQSEKYGEDQFESIWRSGELDATGMKRALTFLEDNETSTKLAKRRNNSTVEETPTPWQYAAQQCLPVMDRWIMACEYEKLWPYTSDDGVNKKVAIVYPDLFGNDFGFRSQQSFEHSENRWNEIPPNVQMSAMASSLPLLRSMGCLVTCHLSVGVSHVLCDLTGGGVDSVEWHPGAKLDVFVDADHGRKLLDRLEETAKSRVLLISRNWVLSKWEE